MNLVTSNASQTEDPEKCANILNDFFSAQFCTQYQLDKNTVSQFSQLGNDNNISISFEGVVKLLTGLKNGKSPGPDDIRKEDLVIDPLLYVA